MEFSSVNTGVTGFDTFFTCKFPRNVSQYKMLDKRTEKLLSVLARLCADGSYKIIEIGDLTKEMLPRFRIDTDALAQMVRYLKINEMIDVKYSDEKVYAIAVLPKGRVTDETRRTQKTTNKLEKKYLVLLSGCCFLAAFAGAVLGAMLMKIF